MLTGRKVGIATHNKVYKYYSVLVFKYKYTSTWKVLKYFYKYGGWQMTNAVSHTDENQLNLACKYCQKDCQLSCIVHEAAS